MTTRRDLGRLLLGAPFAAAVLGGTEARAQMASAPARRGLKIPSRRKLVMIGDSITDAGRARPGGDGAGGPLGRGYVVMVDTLLGAVYADQLISIANTGVSALGFSWTP